MANEEAVEILKVAIAEVEWDYPLDYAIAIEKAIEALENIDRITAERDKAIEDLKECSYCDYCKNYNDECLNNGLCKECSVGKTSRVYWEWRGIGNEQIN